MIVAVRQPAIAYLCASSAMILQVVALGVDVCPTYSRRSVSICERKSAIGIVPMSLCLLMLNTEENSQIITAFCAFVTMRCWAGLCLTISEIEWDEPEENSVQGFWSKEQGDFSRDTN